MKKSLIDNELEELEQKGLKRRLRQAQSPQRARLRVDGQEVLNFCSNNYLGLADDFRLKEAAARCMETEGWGSGASRLVCGNMPAHTLLEERLAAFKGKEACLMFSSGYMANVGILSALFSRGDVIFADKLNHASLIDGVRLSGATGRRYPHKDMTALERMLARSDGAGKRRLIVTDSVFSMDGDRAPLKDIIALAKAYDCMVMIDEAHAMGVFGPDGSGLAAHLGVEDQVDIVMGTLSKAVGSYGAYCCGSRSLIELLIQKARSFIYTTGLPPAVAAASLAGIDIIEQQPALRTQLWDNARYVKKALDAMGWDTMDSQSPIIPLLVGESAKAVALSQKLWEKGILISAIRPPTVPRHTARLRLTVMATHQRKELDYLIAQLECLGKQMGLLQSP
jgi:8-amino-7-oxononanoate synthase